MIDGHHFGDDGDGDVFRSAPSEVEPDGIVDVGEVLGFETLLQEGVDAFLVRLLGAKGAEIAHRPPQGHVEGR